MHNGTNLKIFSGNSNIPLAKEICSYLDTELGDALVTSLRDQSLRKIKFEDDKFINEQIIFKDKIGRIRDIEIQEKTGEIFLITDQGSVWKLSK